ncbi:DUF551 domain-containing protein [Serratia marcescens]|uniref:DUF551 domain-containing protein n=1 Tax=Serratia marcescens TaxID=615 RepID=UPI0006663B52|nr:DUF551 domain-containing protein [Serratia marcescens]
MTRTLTTEQLSQIKADITARKAMPEYGESVEGNIERLRVIGETRSHFSTETVEMLVRALEEKGRALADAERERDDWVEHSRKMEYRAIEAKEKLANREAQPVGFYTTVSGRKGVIWHNGAPEDDTAIYTAPPAPAAVKLPTEFYSDEGVVVRLEQVMAALALVGVKYERRGDACRAAMLAQPVSGGYTLPEGWIACSERMPELDKRVLLYFGSYDGHIEDGCIGDDGDGPYHYFFDGDSLQQEPTHWMPLPAAPEGGNDHDTRR